MRPPRVKICGRNAHELLPLLQRFGLDVDERDPEVVISYGGDGTLLGAERDWPGVAKVALRDSPHCNTCSHHSNEEILEHLARGKLRRLRFLKLKATAGERSLLALNDVIIAHADINAALRFRVEIDGEDYAPSDVIGDGLVVATPFGSSAYFRSITRTRFRAGIGLAFNNAAGPADHLVIGENAVVRVRITRGPAHVTCDNSPDRVPLADGGEVIIRRAEQDAIILVFDKSRYRGHGNLY